MFREMSRWQTKTQSRGAVCELFHIEKWILAWGGDGFVSSGPAGVRRGFTSQKNSAVNVSM